MRVGILTEFPSLAVQSGPALHSRFLHDGLVRRGHDAILVGPDTRSVAPVGDAKAHFFPGFSYPTHPDVKISMPPAPWKAYRDNPGLDVIHGQTNTHSLHWSIWMRQMHQVAVLNTHVVHLPTHSHFLLSDGLYGTDFVREWWQQQAFNMERSFARLYNQGDCMIVQSRHFVDYWRERGVTVPIEVVGRPINPKIFSSQPTHDPYPANFKVGKRMVVVCRHDREKNLRQLIDIFAHEIAPSDPEATLTLVGDGHDHQNTANYAAELPHADRVHFPGEAKHADLVNWYAHADLFVYTSLSETFGNVVNEALWSGLPAVCLNDRMGVAGQVVDRVNGVLVEPERPETNATFGAVCRALLANRERRRDMGEKAANLARRTAHPDVVLGRFEKIYAEARRHMLEHVPVPLSKRGRIERMRVFAQHYAGWAFWNGVLLSVAHAATRLGVTRDGQATQHPVVQQGTTPAPQLAPAAESRPAA